MYISNREKGSTTISKCSNYKNLYQKDTHIHQFIPNNSHPSTQHKKDGLIFLVLRLHHSTLRGFKKNTKEETALINTPPKNFDRSSYKKEKVKNKGKCLFNFSKCLSLI